MADDKTLTIPRPVVVIASSHGKQHVVGDPRSPRPAFLDYIKRGFIVIAPDLFLTGEYTRQTPPLQPRRLDKRYPGYTLTYNRCLLADRVHDFLSTIALATQLYGASDCQVVGWDGAGPVVLLAAALAGPVVRDVIVEIGGKRLADVSAVDDPLLLPGGAKYGDLAGFAGLMAPKPLRVVDLAGSEPFWETTRTVYAALGKSAAFELTLTPASDSAQSSQTTADGSASPISANSRD